MSRFFIDRPIFANVIAVITLILGGVALWQLPIEQFPEITPPTVRLNTVYPGANAQVVAETVAVPIEQQVNGVEGMLYMSSTASSDGSYSLTVTFQIGTDLDMAQVLVQNRVARAEPGLPEEVRRQGITVRKQSPNIVLAFSLTSPEQTYDSLFLANYATLRVRDELIRVPGVGDVNVSGAGEYAMRVWLDPEKLHVRRMTPSDVVNVLREQNIQVAAGRIGQPPTPADQKFQYTVTTIGRLSDPEEFGAIVLRTGEGRAVTYLRDVATVELGAQVYDQFSEQTGKPSANVLIYQLPGSNALQVAAAAEAAMQRLSASFPPDLTYNIPFDTTRFVRSSVNDVYHTLIEAGILVLVVIVVFLHDWRAVLVPATTVPVTIIGAFAFLYALGFTVNMFTLFGLVLAIGIVVDDAIVIVENAAHHIEQGMPPREATIKAMDEVTGPVIAITLVLLAVFLPASFLGGVTGQLYRQFALTIAATALLSAINALTLKPAQSAAWLRPPPQRRGWFTRAFNTVYEPVQRGYSWLVVRILRVPVVMMLIFMVTLGLTGWWYVSLPTGFLPSEDQGYVIVNVQLPDAASLTRTRAVVQRLHKILGETRGVEGWFVLGGFSLLDGAAQSNSATAFVVFEDWDKRTNQDESQPALIAKLQQGFYDLEDAVVFALVPPAIRGLGVGGGFQLQVEDRESVGSNELEARLRDLVAAASQRPEIAQINSTFRSGVPQLFLDINRVKAKTAGVRLTDVFGTLEQTLGSAYVNDFNKFGRTYQVRVQAASRFRREPQDIAQLEVRNAQGQMVPLGSVAQIEQVQGPQIVTRYNLFPSAMVTGSAAPGFSSGQVLDMLELISREVLPPTMGIEWTGVAYQERQVGGQAAVVFGMAVLLVYLVLAAQYESWLLPLAVILVVPLGILGSVAAVWIRGFDNNIYTQVGIVLIIALASKNAILIIEFARELRLAGRSITEAAAEAARLRFRPILMTSFAFILGVVPLVIARGAGAMSRQSLGTVVFGGMITSTVLAIFFVPVFYVVMQWLSELGRRPPPTPPPQPRPAPLQTAGTP